MQRDMKCDVTCCTVTSASHLGILCLASGRSEDTRFTGKSMEQHQLLVQPSESAPNIHQTPEVLEGIEELDGTTSNAWEYEEYATAVKATGSKKLIMAALWTEACLSSPAVDALREGYEVYPVVDAVGGASV